MTRYQIQSAAEEIFHAMGGDAEEICSGECTTFAKRLIDTVGRGVIVSNLSNAMQSELDGYNVESPERRLGDPNRRPECSHCWAKIDGILYDAYDWPGVEDETDLVYYDTMA